MLETKQRKNLYLIAKHHIAKECYSKLEEKANDFNSIEEVIGYLENNGWNNVTEVYEFLMGEDAYAFTKTEKELRVIIKETQEVTE